jgi:hypothetical protein
MGHAVAKYRDPGEELRSFLDNPLPSENVIPETDAAMLVIENGTDYDFGSMDRGDTLEHSFIFRNDGTRPLKLGNPRTTCMCMLPRLESGGIPPGESRAVILRWTPKKYEMDFRQTATLSTSDPSHRVVTLTVFGRILPRSRSVPATVSLGNITTEDERNAQTIIYGYQSDILEVTGTSWLRPEWSNWFDVDFRPATQEELEREPDARAAVVCQLKIKSGLPLGAFHQRLTVDLKTDKESSVEIPIIGTIVGDLTIAGRGYDAEYSQLRIGKVTQGQGKTMTLILTAKGPNREDVKPTIKIIEPADSLTASFEETKSLEKASIHLLKIEVLASSPLTNRLGNDREHPAGRIVIATNHPTIPEIEFSVRFAVAE